MYSSRSKAVIKHIKKQKKPRFLLVLWVKKKNKKKTVKRIKEFRSSRQMVFCKIGVLKNFTRFTGKGVTGLRCFDLNIEKFLITPIL